MDLERYKLIDCIVVLVNCSDDWSRFGNKKVTWMRVYILYQVKRLVIVVPFIDPASSKYNFRSRGSILVQTYITMPNVVYCVSFFQNKKAWYTPSNSIIPVSRVLVYTNSMKLSRLKIASNKSCNIWLFVVYRLILLIIVILIFSI